MEFTATFKREKETKNTVKFEEEPEPGQPPRIGSLYIQKWAANATQRVTVTVKGQ